jgi:hypothetical protein
VGLCQLCALWCVPSLLPPLLHCLLPLRRLLLLAAYRQPAAPAAARISRSWVECASLKDRPLAPALLFVCGLFPLYERSLSLPGRAGHVAIFHPPSFRRCSCSCSSHRPPASLAPLPRGCLPTCFCSLYLLFASSRCCSRRGQSISLFLF